MFKKYSVLHTAKFLFTKLQQFSPSDVVNFFRSCNIYEKITNENCFLSENITYPHNQGLLYRPDESQSTTAQFSFSQHIANGFKNIYSVKSVYESAEHLQFILRLAAPNFRTNYFYVNSRQLNFIASLFGHIKNNLTVLFKVITVTLSSHYSLMKFMNISFIYVPFLSGITGCATSTRSGTLAVSWH